MRIEVDMLEYTIGRILSIECEDGWQRLVSYLLKSLNRTDIRHSLYLIIQDPLVSSQNSD